MTNIKKAKKELGLHKNLEKGEFLKRFFKTGKGEYAEGDIFLGIVVPTTRAVAKKFYNLPLKEVFELLQSKFHEERLLALFILDHKFTKGDEKERETIYKNYLKLAPKYVNNWDLVDSSAPYIVGKYLENKPRDILYKLAQSKNMWERRISIVSTQYLIRLGQFTETLKISEMLLNDKEDLIHKASGWMLREMGKKSEKTLTQFLNKHAHQMPRTMLRYAIEKYPEQIRKKYLSLKK